jgi:mercuric ion transport protein
MVRSITRCAFPVIAWAYVVSLGLQVFFAGMYVFVSPSSIELHKHFVHVIGVESILLIVLAYLGRVDRRDKLMSWAVLGLLAVQGGLVHVHQIFDMPMVAALHPVNALALTWAVVTLARRSNRYFVETDALAAAETRRPTEAEALPA